MLKWMSFHFNEVLSPLFTKSEPKKNTDNYREITILQEIFVIDKMLLIT